MPIMNVTIPPQLRQRTLEFARTIILGNNQFDRLLPDDVRRTGNLESANAVRIQRTYVGKIGEVAFAQALINRGVQVDFEPMFEIFEGQSNVDGFDFETADNQTVDIKTGFRANHSRLMVNLQQMNEPKDFYVGVKLNIIDPDLKQKIINVSDTQSATIYGYATGDVLVNTNTPRNFGEGDARWLMYSNLMDINELLAQF